MEDALFSAKSMAIMFGNGKVKSYKGEKTYIMKTEQFVATAAGDVPAANEGVYSDALGWKAKYEAPDGTLYTKVNPKFYDENGVTVTKLVKDSKYFCSYDLKADGSVIEISASSFPGTLTYRAPLWGSKILTNQFGELLEAVA